MPASESSPMAAAAPEGRHAMQCMEVWGGNTAIDAAVTMPGLNVWVYARPHEGHSAGGDVHYVSSCATGRISRLMVADVAGHGTGVAELARSLRDMMRRYINFLDQGRFIGTLNQEFTRRGELGKFATAIVATYWAPTDYLVASNAGHPRPLLFRAKERTWTVLTDPRKKQDRAAAEQNLPLGIDDVARYDQFAVRLQPGDVVLMYTDSLLEARVPGAAASTMLGELGLLKLVAGLDASDPRKLVHELVDAVHRHAGGQPDDDLTIVALSASGDKPVPTLASRWSALVSFLQTLAGAWKQDAPPVPWPEFSAVNLLGPFFPWLNRRPGSGGPSA